jgi:hypothetical protein
MVAGDLCRLGIFLHGLGNSDGLYALFFLAAIGAMVEVQGKNYDKEKTGAYAPRCSIWITSTIRIPPYRGSNNHNQRQSDEISLIHPRSLRCHNSES